MSDLYPFDPDVRAHVARLLYDLLPALYRVRDEEGQELWRFLPVLAAPLAELRQNIEELHGDLFIDTCNDWIIPYLAEMVGTTLIFPDALSNRRDVRGAVTWRRRKGTRDALEEMGSDLSGQVVVTREGWTRLLVAQDLNMLRPERTITDVRPATLAESASGPLDAAYHALDPRGISARSGRYHPRHIVHWTHPTQLFPVREGTPADRTRYKVDGKPLVDLRYAVDPLGLQSALRVRRTHPGDPIPTDRIPPMHFAASPGAYFDQEGRSSGRFCVRLSGLPAAVAAPVHDLRQARKAAAHASLLAARVDVTLLEEPLDRLSSAVRLEIFAVPLAGALPDVAGARWRGGALVPVQAPSEPVDEALDLAPLESPVAMIRLRAAAAGVSAYFPGATIELSSRAVDARHASDDATLAADGFLRGALLVEVPAAWVSHEQGRWFYLAADGSVYEAQSPQALAPDIEVHREGATISFQGEARATGPGPAWPPLGRTAAQERMRRVPSAPGRGPVLLRAAPVRKKSGQALEVLGTSPRMALTFAARVGTGGPGQYEPFLRLFWTGDDPLASDAFEVLDANGAPIDDSAGPDTPEPRGQRFRAIAELREDHPSDIELVVRFEAEEADLVLPPCEVAYTSDDGQALLIHLPELATSASTASDWAESPPPYGVRSLPIAVGEDGATYVVGGIAVARHALGPVAPLQAPTLRRRRVRQRNLCGWSKEEPASTPPKLLAATPRGFLDVDPEHGLFALAKDEPPRRYPALSGSTSRPSPVTVDYLEGYSDHIGARPGARAPILDERQPRPTRIVSASGKLHPGAPPDWHTLPRYTCLLDALAAISAGAARVEVIQIEDSATYGGLANLEWPIPPAAHADDFELVVQAAESQRPVLRLDEGWSTSTSMRYASITLRGLLLDAPSDLPAANHVSVQFCTTGALTFRAPPDKDALIEVERCITGQLSLNGPGTLRVRDSVIDDLTQAIEAPAGTCELERVTALSGVYGPHDAGTVVLVLEATHTIFQAKVVALDRFHGCIRYSRAPGDSVLPRKHRVVDAPPRFVARGRHDPAHARLAQDCAPEIVRGAEDGSEMGAFHGVRLAQRQEALARRLVDFTPAGLTTGIVRID